eukprot:GHVN01027779.1.p1 GENE.GHVN01027779.1~~GHVN01027779.1.p1  ORF type:complete len:108 (+),score=17.62 GHVN01027779.1:420-743(+)
MFPNAIGNWVGDSICTVTSVENSEAACTGALCAGSFNIAGSDIVAMTSLGGDALVQSSSPVTCTNPGNLFPPHTSHLTSPLPEPIGAGERLLPSFRLMPNETKVSNR